MRKVVTLVALVSLLGLGFWLYRVLFPSHEARIRRLLVEVAETASLKANENQLSRLAAAAKLAGFCTADVVVDMEGAGLSPDGIHGREELQQMAAAARISLQSVEVRLLDIHVNIDIAGGSATARMAAIADVDGEANAVVQELKMGLVILDGDWKISRVETVKTLSM